MSSRRKLRRNLRRFIRYQARYLRVVTPSRRLTVTVAAASRAHFSAIERLSAHPAEAYAQWRRTDEGSHTCQRLVVRIGRDTNG